ncbi:hypothetical protein [Flavobacterium notoginsengisoli]|uniref:hypothetical protein n=1 Tax=Flavobacterium notoginsengisoli TaxID=1478199 RepID=UPI00362F2A91
MKKIISIFSLGMLFSCANEAEATKASTDAEIIRLMKTPDKNTLTLSQRKRILEYLDKHPEDSKYLNTYDPSTFPKPPIMTPGLKERMKTGKYILEDYLQIQVVPQGAPDYGASVEIIKLDSIN